MVRVNLLFCFVWTEKCQCLFFFTYLTNNLLILLLFLLLLFLLLFDKGRGFLFITIVGHNEQIRVLPARI